MKLQLLPDACDLAVRRGWLLERIDAVERADVDVNIGGIPMAGSGLAAVRSQLLQTLHTDLAVCEQNLIAIGVDIGDAGTRADIPACRVEA